MKYFKEKLPNIFKKLFDNQDIIIDIETFDFKEKSKQLNRKIYNIAVYNLKKDRGISFTIKDNLEILVKSDTFKEIDYIKKYYDNLESSFLISETLVKQCFNNTTFNKTIGYNIVNFDIPILKNQGYQIKTSKIIDLYYLVSRCLPKKYLDYCIQNKLITSKNNPVFNAEAVYNFIQGNNKTAFEIEKHSALYDCIIEAKIYEYCYKRIGAKHTDNTFNFLSVWKNFINRFKKIDWQYNSYFKKIIEQEI